MCVKEKETANAIGPITHTTRQPRGGVFLVSTATTVIVAPRDRLATLVPTVGWSVTMYAPERGTGSANII